PAPGGVRHHAPGPERSRAGRAARRDRRGAVPGAQPVVPGSVELSSDAGGADQRAGLRRRRYRRPPDRAGIRRVPHVRTGAAASGAGVGEMTRLGLMAIACALFAATLAPAQQPASGRSFHDRYAELVRNPRKLSDSTRLHELFRLNWQYVMTEYPEFATYVGYPGENARWTDNSLQAIERRKQELQQPLGVVKAIRRDRLSSTDRLNYDLFRRGLEEQIEGTRFKDEYFAITQLGGVQQDVGQLLAQMPTTNVQDYEDILARLNGVPALVDQTLVLLGKGLEAGITPPRVTLRDVPDQIRGITPDDPMASPLLRPFAQFPSIVPAGERERLTQAARDAYTQRVAPAYRKLYDYVVGTYLP